MGRYVFRLPDVGEGIAEAEITAWYVKVGDLVTEDQSLADVMTDKATVEIASPVSGTVIALHGAIGSKAAVGSALLEFEVEGSGNVTSAETQGHMPLASTPSKVAEPQEVLASPSVRKRAAELGINLTDIIGSGRNGIVTSDDLDRHLAKTSLAGPATVGDVEQIRIVGLRRVIADKMTESKRRIPHFTYVEEIDVVALEDLREHLNQQKPVTQPKLTPLPIIIAALAKTLRSFPQMNATFDDDAGVVTRSKAVHVGIATQTPNGLMVPVLRHAETRTIWEIAQEIARLAEAARSGQASREELSGSTITVTSLGVLGGILHTPVINRPEVAIVGPNRIAERPVVRDGQIVVRKVMNLSSSFDHRIIDGYDAAEFIQSLRLLIEQPEAILDQ